MGILSVCSIVAIIGVLFLIGGFMIDEAEDLIGIGIVILAMIGLFGFGLVANMTTIKSTSVILIPDEMAKSKNTLFVKCEDTTIQNGEAKFVMASNDMIRVKKTINYNAYDTAFSTSYSLTLADQTEK